MSDLFGVEVPEVTGLHNLLTLACETASLVGDTGLFPKLSALLTMAAWNKDRSEGLERGEIERMMYYAKPEETDVTGDVEAFLTKNDADGNKVVNTSELEIAVQTAAGPVYDAVREGGVGVDEPETEPLVFESTEHVDLHEEPPRKDLPTTGIGF